MRWILIGIALIACSLIVSSSLDMSCGRCTGLTIVTWNVQNLGPTKVTDGRAAKIIEHVRGADIIVLQEITDASGDAGAYLCSQLDRYDCRVSPRSGGTQGEQYLIASKYPIGSTRLIEDPRLARGMYEATIELGSRNLTIATEHLTPSRAGIELAALEDLLDADILAGDLNAGCSYLPEGTRSYLPRMRWIVPDTTDTTSGPTACAYDRFAARPRVLGMVAGYRVLAGNTSLSDHDPVELVLN